MKNNKFRVAVFARHIGQSTAACLTAMTQGDLGAVTLAHWKVALTTGTGVGLFGMLMTFGSLIKIQTSRWGVAAVAFAGTTASDLYAHPTHYGTWWTEAFATGLGAAGLCLLLSFTPIGKAIEKLEK
jgi:hypothetical protein